MEEKKTVVENTEAKQETAEEKKFGLTRERCVKMFFHVLRQLDDPYYGGIGAQIAYFFFMASIPTLIVLSQVLGVFDVSLDIILGWMQKNVGGNLSGFVESLFTQSKSVGVTNALLIILAIWAASGLEFSLSRLMTHILTDGRYRFTFVAERLKSLILVFIYIAGVGIILVTYVYGEILINKLLGNTFLANVLLWSRGPLLLVVLFVVILETYVLLPRVRVPYKAVRPGAVLATAAMFVVTKFYSIYVGRTTSYDILYGSFANIVALLLWFYLISWILCLGMMFNKSWDIYMARGRLSPKRLKEIIMSQKGINEKNLSKYYSSNPSRFNRLNDTIANQLSRKYVKGYAEARDANKDVYDNAPDREKDS